MQTKDHVERMNQSELIKKKFSKFQGQQDERQPRGSTRRSFHLLQKIAAMSVGR